MPLEPILTVDDLNRFLETDFSEVHTDGKIFEVIATGPGFATMRLDPTGKAPAPRRHGFRADACLRLPTSPPISRCSPISARWRSPSPPISTSTSCRKPKLGPLQCTCRILKLGKRLAVLDAAISELDGDELVAHATATYSIPPR